MSLHRRKFVAGLIAVLASNPIRIGKGEQGEPVAYLYNGVQLPNPDLFVLSSDFAEEILSYDTAEALDEMRALNYSHHALYGPLNGKYYFFYYSSAAVDATYNWEMPAPYLMLESDIVGTETFGWHIFDYMNSADITGDLDYTSFNRDELFWADHDVYAADGTLCLAGSEAVPIYE